MKVVNVQYNYTSTVNNIHHLSKAHCVFSINQRYVTLKHSSPHELPSTKYIPSNIHCHSGALLQLPKAAGYNCATGPHMHDYKLYRYTRTHNVES